MTRLASRERFSFGQLREVLALPDLIAVQRESFQWFLDQGIAEVLRDISPIEDFTGQLKLELTDHVFDPPKHSEDECRERDMTFARPLFVTARFMNAGTGEIKEQTVFMGDFPMMTARGTFIINGTERIVVSQLVRSPGVYFAVTPDKTSPEKDIVSAKMIPGRGAWLEFEVDKKGVVYVRIDRKRKQPVTILLKALGFGETEDELLNLILDPEGRPYDSMRNTLDKDNTESADAAFIDIYRKLRPGEPPTPDSARSLIENLFFNPKRYDMAKVGRHKVSKKLVDEYAKVAKTLKRLDIPVPNADPDKGVVEYTMSRADILSTVSYLVKLHANDQPNDYFPDDIDHFGNRRVRSVGELIMNQVRVGLSRMERVVRERMTTQDVEAITPQTLINIRPVVAAIKEFFGSSQLSQFMDQTNPLAGLTHKRRLSALGPGGLSRERAGFEVRDVHPSHYGRMCPIETPEGPNIGLIGYLSCYARINRFGFIETPYRLVTKGVVTDTIHYLAADDEDRHVIAQANAVIDDNGKFINDKVLVRAGRGEVAYVDPDEVHYMDVSPKQMVSIATALIPFLEHDDANLALMGANMQRQAVPTLRPEAPYIGTGVEARAARDAGELFIAEGDGVVTDVSGSSITVSYNHVAKPVTYRLSKFRRSNQGTCINQKALVSTGDQVTEGDVLADGPSTHQGELALGKNLLVAFVPWKGHNFEDAIVLSERLVRDDVLTSIHIEEHEIDARDTKLGAEEITRDIPNLSEDILKDLDERGIIRIGAEVGPGDVLVGKVTPKGETELTPEERLLRAIFGEKAREVRDTSLKVPHGETGKVIDVRVFSRDDGDELPPGVNQLVRVYVAQKRKISEGDKLAGRHGNKGVISKILPVEDMPHLADGTPVDIVLNPLGVPSRMNVGQVLEAHLGYAARHGWEGQSEKPAAPNKTRTITEPAVWVTTPVFDGAHWDEEEEAGPQGTIQHLFQTMHSDWAGDPGLDTSESTVDVERRKQRPNLVNDDGKATLYDGRTGEAFDNPVTVGYVYILKLSHLVDDKIHARSTGPYSMITQQPLGGKAQFGGQRFGEMEVWALEAYGAAYALQE
ncbi:MAG: DNA-directed RNA polymerase subunit beta, partial [Acidimicrobiia bacterium]|nr:DNA-directed RNA polymerase subunit beta [Acidimicrobiia bacterium]